MGKFLDKNGLAHLWGKITAKISDSKYTLPAANGSTLGGVKDGGDVTIASGAITVKNGSHHTHSIANVSGLQGELDKITTKVSDSKYTLPAANGSTLGGVKDGGDVTIANGVITVKNGSHHTHSIANVSGLQGELDKKAPLASPVLTGTPTAPTAAAGTSSTQIATTAFVQWAVGNACALTDENPEGISFGANSTNVVVTLHTGRGDDFDAAVIAPATASKAGVMSAEDKKKLDELYAALSADLSQLVITFTAKESALTDLAGSANKTASVILSWEITKKGGAAASISSLTITDGSGYSYNGTENPGTTVHRFTIEPSSKGVVKTYILNVKTKDGLTGSASATVTVGGSTIIIPDPGVQIPGTDTGIVSP